MMEWVFRNAPQVDPYIDDIIIGSIGNTVEELVSNHTKDVIHALEIMEEQQLTDM